ncbi:MAG: nitroreductase family protein [Theionarchaea archaeon]|nr:MAG: nitroreductase [Theionarchaea archaeon DG-70]MBU7012221.1 nitroreductase family protein [Theionarchaea archaeon]
MELHEAIRERKSIRAFVKKEIPPEYVTRILEAAILAPSEGNLQSWRFFVVKNEEIKKRLADAALGQMFVVEAPVTIVVCINLKDEAPYGRRGRELYAIQSSAAAIENMLLTAVSLGLGACWVGAFREEAVRAVLNLENAVRPVALIPVGYPAESPSPRGRKSVKEVTFFVE